MYKCITTNNSSLNLFLCISFQINYYKTITSLCGNRLVLFCNMCLLKIIGINTNIVIKNVHPVTTPKASGLKLRNIKLFKTSINYQWTERQIITKKYC